MHENITYVLVHFVCPRVREAPRARLSEKFNHSFDVLKVEFIDRVSIYLSLYGTFALAAMSRS